MRPCGGVDEEHPPRLQAALADDLGWLDVDHADLAGQHDEAVVGDPEAPGPQPVAVEHRADQRAVGEAHARRPVPRLHQRGVEAVERPLVDVHRGVVLPRLGDHHHHRVGQRAAAEVQQLEHLVERRRVAAARRADRVGPLQAGEQVAGQQRLAGAHPVAVALHRVDLAVVGDVAVRVGQRPRRERVRREPAVHQGDAPTRRARRAGRRRTRAAAAWSASPCRSRSASRATGSTSTARDRARARSACGR